MQLEPTNEFVRYSQTTTGSDSEPHKRIAEVGLFRDQWGDVYALLVPEVLDLLMIEAGFVREEPTE